MRRMNSSEAAFRFEASSTNAKTRAKVLCSKTDVTRMRMARSVTIIPART